MTGRPAYIRPDRWQPAYNLTHRIDTAAETITGIAVSIGLIAACGLIHLAQTINTAQADWLEHKANKHMRRMERWDSDGCVGFPEDEWT